MGGVVGLVNLISREVGGVNIGLQLRLEWCANAAEGVEFNATEELVVLDLICTSTT